MSKIKICGLFLPCDIAYVNEAKPDWCGFIINYPKSHRSVTPEQVRSLVKKLHHGIVPVGVFVDQPVEQVAALINDGTISVAQLHGQEDLSYLSALRNLAPGCQVWKAFSVQTPADLAAANASTADLVLLDSGSGTGRTFDWSLAESVTRPFLLAGGLTPENIPDAVARLNPYGLDLSSGVESGQKKDRSKIAAAVYAARKKLPNVR